MKKRILIIFLIALTGCAINKEEKNSILSNNITVVKFMYLYDYPMAISTKSFWEHPREHAEFKLPLGKNTFLDEIKTLPKNNCDSLTFLNYAFIIKKKGNENDTIYADFTLKTWIFKEKRETICYYDEKGFFSKFLRQNYPFFKDCW